MKIEFKRLHMYNCKTKHILVIDGEAVAGADSQHRISKMSGYIQGVYSEEDIIDKSIIRVLKQYKSKYEQESRLSKAS